MKSLAWRLCLYFRIHSIIIYFIRIKKQTNTNIVLFYYRAFIIFTLLLTCKLNGKVFNSNPCMYTKIIMENNILALVEFIINFGLNHMFLVIYVVNNGRKHSCINQEYHFG